LCFLNWNHFLSGALTTKAEILPTATFAELLEEIGVDASKSSLSYIDLAGDTINIVNDKG